VTIGRERRRSRNTVSELACIHPDVQSIDASPAPPLASHVPAPHWTGSSFARSANRNGFPGCAVREDLVARTAAIPIPIPLYTLTTVQEVIGRKGTLHARSLVCCLYCWKNYIRTLPVPNANPLRAGIVYCAIYGAPYQRLSC
jgi:hypothetical protein